MVLSPVVIAKSTFFPERLKFILDVHVFTQMNLFMILQTLLKSQCYIIFSYFVSFLYC